MQMYHVGQDGILDIVHHNEVRLEGVAPFLPTTDDGVVSDSADQRRSRTTYEEVTQHERRSFNVHIACTQEAKQRAFVEHFTVVLVGLLELVNDVLECLLEYTRLS